tara:strand:+ start:199 stop:462 length:264 start_codon:yes stop_codon:yes gene_type:complete
MKSLKGKKGMKKGHFGDGPWNTGMGLGWMFAWLNTLSYSHPTIHDILVLTVLILLSCVIVLPVLYGLLLLVELYRRKKGIKDEDNDK